jgi:hypothetical protein
MTVDIFTAGLLANLYGKPAEDVEGRAYRRGFPDSWPIGWVWIATFIRWRRGPFGIAPVPTRLRTRDRRRLRAALLTFGVYAVAVVLAVANAGVVEDVFIALAAMMLAASTTLLLVWTLTRIQLVLTADEGHVVIRGLDRSSASRFAQSLGEGHDGLRKA